MWPSLYRNPTSPASLKVAVVGVVVAVVLLEVVVLETAICFCSSGSMVVVVAI